MVEDRVRRSVGEQWSNTYRNPTFDPDVDQDNNALLVSDVRRVTRIALIVVTAFAIALMLSGGVEAGINLIMIVDGPILVIAGAGRLVRWYTQRELRPHTPPRPE